MQQSVGEDLVHYASACADKIPDLQIFKESCKPIFLFIASGVLVAFIHGANSGCMRSKIQEELDKEMSVLGGKDERKIIEFEEAIPPSDLHLDADFDRLEEEERLRNKGSAKEISYKIQNGRILLVHKTIIDESKKYDVMKEYLPSCGFQILDKKGVEIVEDDVKQMKDAPTNVKEIFSDSKCGLIVVRYGEDSDQDVVKKAFDEFFSLSSEVPKGAKVKPLQKKLELKDSIGFFCLDDSQSVYFVKKYLKLEFETGQYEEKKI